MITKNPENKLFIKQDFPNLIHKSDRTVGYSKVATAKVMVLWKEVCYMRTKMIYSSKENHSGYGAGSGDTERYEYECPCGKSII